MDDKTRRLLTELRRPDAFPLFFTGAGVSLASGIPTFRGTDPEAVWANDVLEKGTYAYFMSDPVASWEWYLDRFDKARHAEPNPAHHACAKIERKVVEAGGRFMLVTQNVDGLHLAAGTQNRVEIHGAARKMRCSRKFAQCQFGEPDGFMDWDEELFKPFREDPCIETLPLCPECGSLMRAHVLWFDEGYTDHEDYGLDELFQVVEQVTALVCVGTSFAVNIASLLLTTAYQNDVPVFIIDPGRPPDEEYFHFPAQAEVFLPALADVL